MELAFTDISLDDGWQAVSARFEANSPIALLIVADQHQVHYSTRLDLGKRMVIDAIPHRLTSPQLARIASQIAGALKRRRRPDEGLL